MARRALITGGTGYIGSKLADHLVAEDWAVDIVIRPGSEHARLPKQTEFHVHDGTAAGMIRLVTSARPDVVFHLASLPRVVHETRDIDPMIAANVGFGAQLLEAMASCGCRKLITAGTYAAYDAAGDYCPNSLYAATKHAFEVLALYYARRYGIRAITLVLYDVYGEGDWRDKFLSKVARALVEGKPLAATPGDQVLDCVHVDDVVRGFMVAAGLLERQEITDPIAMFRLDTGRRLPLRQLAELLARIAGRPLPIQWGGLHHPPLQIMEPLNTGPRLPGWEPRVSLEQGLAALWDETCVRADAGGIA